MIGTIKQQVKELLAELSRVDWPTKDKVWSSTISIVVVSAFVGFFLWGADWLISYTMKFLLPNH
ncbi:MAG: preprotein translocase subunit SecE [Acidobacteria bacterium]|nr:preprotein translocase subunit SecE [Acidobacteriota bacterium]